LWNSNFVCYNEKKNGFFVIDKNCSNLSTVGGFGYISLRSDDLTLLHKKMMYKSNERSAKTQNYSIIGYDSTNNQVITTLTSTSKTKSFVQLSEPTRLRRYPIGFNTSGLIGCFCPSNLSSKVYFDNESTKDITSYDKKQIDEDIYDLLGYCNPQDTSESASKTKKDNSNKYVLANQV